MMVRDRVTLPKDIRNILVIQLGDIGDVVWSVPTFHSLRNAFPGGRVSVLLREGMKSLLEADPNISKIYEIKHYRGGFVSRQRHHLDLIRDLRSAGFDCAFDLRSDDRGAFMGYLTGAPIRASLYHPDASLLRNRLFTHLLAEPVPPEDRIHGAAEQSLRIVRGFGIETSSVSPKLWVSDQMESRVKQLLLEEGMGAGTSWLTLNPFSRWSYKEWGYDRWVSIIDWLMETLGIATVLVGAETERSKADGLIGSCRVRAFNLAGRTTLAELAGVLSLSRLHIGVDSAAPHIAAAAGTATVTLYGPSDWRDWAPVGDSHRVVVSDMHCVPCYRKGCDGSGRSRCLEGISTDEVKKVLQDALVK